MDSLPPHVMEGAGGIPGMHLHVIYPDMMHVVFCNGVGNDVIGSTLAEVVWAAEQRCATQIWVLRPVVLDLDVEVVPCAPAAGLSGRLSRQRQPSATVRVEGMQSMVFGAQAREHSGGVFNCPDAGNQVDMHIWFWFLPGWCAPG